MERGITTRRLSIGVALELMPYVLFRLDALLQSFWGHVHVLHTAGYGLFLLFLVSGVGWLFMGQPVAALAAFMWRILSITIIGASSWMEGNCATGCDRGDMYWWTMAFGWFALLAVPAVSAFMLWRWGRSVGRDDLSDGSDVNHDGVADPVNAPNRSVESV